VGCVFWESVEAKERVCGAACDPGLLREWYLQVTEEWGDCGRVALQDDEVLGFIKYAPSRYVPQAATFPSRPYDGDIPLITCLHVSDEARQHGLGRLLVQSALKDLKGRGERTVQSFASSRDEDLSKMPMVGMKYLLDTGFTVVRSDPAFPLMQLDLRSLASVAENLESVLESLRIPLRAPSRVPGPTVGAN
jgi:GNAT superfamily N-acetyltransferase